MSRYQISRYGVRVTGSKHYLAGEEHYLADSEFVDTNLSSRDAGPAYGLVRAATHLSWCIYPSADCRVKGAHAPHTVRVTGNNAHDNVRVHHCDGRPEYRELALSELYSQIQQLLAKG